MSSARATVSFAAAAGLLLALGLGLFAVRLAGPPDLTDNDQEGPTAYVLDVLQNGHWAVQRDGAGDIASKPPLYTWLAAIAALAGGGLNRFTLYLPCALAVVGTALLTLRLGAGRFGVVAGLIAGFSILFSQFGLKHVALARTDAVFMGTVALGAVAAFRAWETGRGWVAFWLAVAAASLTKGPLGLVLAAGGLLASFWERKEENPRISWRAVLPGAGLWLAVVGGWFVLAYLAAGDALIEKQLGRELVGHLSGKSAGGHWPGSQPFHPAAYFLSRFAPWSLLACAGFWRVWCRPAATAPARRLERFLFCWFAVGLAIFIVAPHKRADLLLPMIPAAALLAGRELAGWLHAVRPAVVWRWAAAVGLLILASLPALSRLKTEAPEAAAQTRAMQRLADWIRSHVPAEVPVTLAGNLMTLEFYLQRHQFHTTPGLAARLLSARTPCVCAVGAAESEALRRALPAGTEVHVLAREPAEGTARVELLSNRSALGIGPAAAVGIGPLAIELTHSRLSRPQGYALDLESRAAKAEARLRNLGSRPVKVEVCWGPVGPARCWGRVLSAGDTWSLDVSGEDQGRKRRERWRDQWQAFDEDDRTNPPPREAMLFVGSSTIRLWTTLEADFPDYLTVRRGFGGGQIEDLTAEADRLIFRHAPRVILVYAGDNDLADGKSPERVADDFGTLVARVHERLPDAFLGFLAIKPSVQRRHLLAEIRAANALVRETTSRDPRLFYVDVFDPMLGTDGEPRVELLAADGLHLSPEGYRVWARTIQAALQANPALAGVLATVRRGEPPRSADSAERP